MDRYWRNIGNGSGMPFAICIGVVVKMGRAVRSASMSDHGNRTGCGISDRSYLSIKVDDGIATEVGLAMNLPEG